jgi:hypothetical protein
MTTVRFTPGLDGHVVAFAYHPAAVGLIKQTVPGYARSWGPHRRVWIVDPAWAHILADTLRCYGHTVVGLDAPRQTHAGDADWARALFRRVGPSRAGPVFRSLSRILHPDAGGDTQLQRELNAAHAEISQRKDPAA